MMRQTKRIIALTLVGIMLVSTTIFAQGNKLRSLDGGAVDLSALRGKVVVLYFGGTWIPMASRELSTLQKIADRYTPRGVQFYWVCVNSARSGARNYASDEDLKAFVQKNNIRMSVLRDPDLEAYQSFGLDAIPTLVLLDPEGKVARKLVGFGTEQGDSTGTIVRELEQLLK
jgi:peroxiredoxin